MYKWSGFLLFALAGCTDRTTVTTAAPPAPARIMLTPDSSNIEMYDTVHLSARVFDAVDAPINDAPLTRETLRPTVAVIGNDGVVMAVRGGLTEITVRSGDAHATSIV